MQVGYEVCLLISGHSNGVSLRHGIDNNPNKLKQLEVQRQELGLYFYKTFFVVQFVEKFPVMLRFWFGGVVLSGPFLQQSLPNYLCPQQAFCSTIRYAIIAY